MSSKDTDRTLMPQENGGSLGTQLACYAGVPSEVVNDCEHIYTMVRAVRLEALHRIQTLLAPYGQFKQWCRDHDENYGSVQYALSQAYGDVSKRPVEETSIGGLLQGPAETEAQTIIRAQTDRLRALEAEVALLKARSPEELLAEAQRLRQEAAAQTAARQATRDAIARHGTVADITDADQLLRWIGARMQLNVQQAGDPFYHRTSTTEPGKIIYRDPILEGALQQWRELRPQASPEPSTTTETTMDKLNRLSELYAERFGLEAATEEGEVTDLDRKLVGFEAALGHFDLYHGAYAAQVRRLCAARGYPSRYGFYLQLIAWGSFDMTMVRLKAEEMEQYEREAEAVGVLRVLDLEGADEAAIDAAITQTLTWEDVQRLTALRHVEEDADADADASDTPPA